MDIIIAFNLLKNHDDDDDEVYVIHCTVLVTEGEHVRDWFWLRPSFD